MDALERVHPVNAAPAHGPCSPAIRSGAWLFVSGQIAVAPDGRALADADLETQTRQCRANLRAVLEAGGATLDRVAKVTVQMSEPDGWPPVNRVYAEVRRAPPGARDRAGRSLPRRLQDRDRRHRAGGIGRPAARALFRQGPRRIRGQTGRTPNSQACSQNANTTYATPPTPIASSVPAVVPGA